MFIACSSCLLIVTAAGTTQAAYGAATSYRHDTVKSSIHSSAPCTFDFPPSTFPGDTTLGLQCTTAIKSVRIQRKLLITSLSKWAITSSGSLSAGDCTGRGTTTATCALGPGLPAKSSFMVAFDPLIKNGEPLVITLKPATGAPIVEKFAAPAGPKLDVKATVTPDTSVFAAPAGTAWDFSVAIAGGSYYELRFELPPGVAILYTLRQATNGLQCGEPFTGGFNCSVTGSAPALPGTFTFVIQLTKPIPQGTKSPEEIWNTGLQQGKATLTWNGTP